MRSFYKIVQRRKKGLCEQQNVLLFIHPRGTRLSESSETGRGAMCYNCRCDGEVQEFLLPTLPRRRAPTNAGGIVHLRKRRHGCRHTRQMLSTTAIRLSREAPKRIFASDNRKQKLFLDTLDKRITTGQQEQHPLNTIFRAPLKTYCRSGVPT